METMTRNELNESFPKTQNNESSSQDAEDEISLPRARRCQPKMNASQLGLDTTAAAAGGETIKPKKMRVKRPHEGHDPHRTKRRLTEILATVHEDEEEVVANDGDYRPAVKLHAPPLGVRQQTADDVIMHRRLQFEHLKLQKHFALVQSLLAEATRRHTKQVSDLEDELLETRERHDLIEFQLLEIEQCQLKNIGKVVEKGVNTLLAGRCCEFNPKVEDSEQKGCVAVMAKVDDNDGGMQKQLKDIQKECRDLSVKINTKEKMQQELQKKITSLERTEEELVSKNLKLYIDYVGAREELQKLSLMKLEPQRCPVNKLQERSVEEPYGHCTSVTSEDEGLGEDSRREDSTGPNSLILDAEEEYRGHFDGVIVGLRQRETSLATQLCQAEARISELQDRLNVKEEQVLKLLSETCNYAMFQEQLSLVDRRRSELQEQVLELEEAENDSRSEAQRLQMVVLKMEERERLLEDEIHSTRLELESCECRLRGMEITDRELQAQVSYTEALVCKYEKHIGELESAESSLHQKIVELDHQLRIAKRSKVETKSAVSQTTNPHSEIRNGIQLEERCIQTEAPSQKDLAPVSTGCKDSLIFRLKQLEEKDGVLREQLHQMDGINLMLWQKLHSLDNNIELCKKQERRNFADETRHQVASARLDDLLANPPPPPKQPEIAEEHVQNMVVSLEENELKNRLVQLEQEHNDMQKDLEAERMKRVEDVQKMDEEKLALEKELKRVEDERDQLKDNLLRAQGSQEGCHNYDHLTFTICQLREEEVTLRSDLALHELRVQEMCHEFEKQLTVLTDTHGQREESWKNEVAILREKECEYQEELRSLRETRMSLKSEIGSMIREKNAVLFELQQKLISLEGKKKASKPVEELKVKTYNDKCLQTCDFQSQSEAENSDQSEAKICDVVQSESGCLPSAVETTCLTPNLPEDGICDKMETELSESKSSIQVQNNPDDVQALLATIQQLRDKGNAMEKRMEELHQKESAYIETLENADKIISNLERGYQEKIVQLESSEKNLRQRIVELEESENQLREMMSQPERRSSADGWRISDLIKELLAAESRENALKEHADEVEASHRTLLQKLRELERGNQQLREESQEQEEVLMVMREKQGALREELAQVHQSESALRLTLHQADEILAQRERSVLDQVEELVGEKRHLEETVERLQDEMAVLKLANVRLQEDDIGTSAEQVNQEKRPVLSLEDVSVGLDARLELEECMTRAMAAMERDMQHKTSIDGNENIRSSDSTSGCESDCSSNYIWPTSEDSDSDHGVDEPRPKKMLMTSSETSATVPSRILYPTGTFTRSDKKAKSIHDKQLLPNVDGENESDSRTGACKKANQESLSNHTAVMAGPLLPPDNFSILRQVGKDSILVGWKPRVAKSSPISYQIFVDGQLQQKIRSSDRTKALLHKLDLSAPLNISIRSITPDGDVSEPTCAFFTAATQNSTPAVKV